MFLLKLIKVNWSMVDVLTKEGRGVVKVLIWCGLIVVVSFVMVRKIPFVCDLF